MKFRYGLVVAVLGPALACGGGKRDAQIRVSGYVEATEVRVSTKIGGTLVWFPVEEGDAVRAGQEFARVDTVDLRLALDEARAEKGEAEARLKLLEAGFREEEIAAARADVEREQAGLEAAEKDLERMQGLLDAGSGTPKARDEARARRDAAAARHRAAEENLRKLLAGSRRQEIEAARARVEAAGARIARLEQQVTDATVLCPLDGVVTDKVAERGEVLAPGGLLALVTDIRDAWLTVYLSEPDLGRIRLGQPAEVVTDDGTKREGRVTYVASEAEFTPKNVQMSDQRVKLVYEVKLSLQNEDGLFKPGMPADARIRPVEGEAPPAGEEPTGVEGAS